MNKCEQYCRTIKRMANAGGGILPREYQQVEYLQSSGEQIIDTGTNVSSTLKIALQFEITSGYQYGNNSQLFGAAYFSGANSTTAYFLSFPSATTTRVPNYHDNSYGVTTVNNSSVASGVHNLEYSKDGFVLDSVLVSKYAYPCENSITVCLFGRNVFYDNTWFYNMVAGIRIYRAQLGTAINPILYGDYIPCYRKSDNKPGMYDLVTNAFFTNAGTGEFILGPEIR